MRQFLPIFADVLLSIYRNNFFLFRSRNPLLINTAKDSATLLSKILYEKGVNENTEDCKWFALMIKSFIMHTLD